MIELIVKAMLKGDAMKIKRFSVVLPTALLILLLAASGPAPAQTQPEPFQVEMQNIAKPKPKLTTPGYIAMLFAKLTGQKPEFENWARQSKSYSDASKFDKVLAEKEKIAELQNVYSLITATEPITVEMPVKLSQYSRVNQGFFVDNFKSDTFFDFQFFDKNYAVVPSNLLDRQWIKTSASQAEQINNIVKVDVGNRASITLYLEPKFADATAPQAIDGADYWLISAEVTKIAIYYGDRLVWESENNQEAEAVSQELLNLKQ